MTAQVFTCRILSSLGLVLLLGLTVGCYSLAHDEGSGESDDSVFDADSGNDSDTDDQEDTDPSDDPSDDGLEDGSDDGPDDGSDDGSDDPVDPPPEEDAAEVLGADLPVQGQCGEQITATVTMLNRGTATWTREQGYKLGAVDDTDPLYSGGTRVWLPEDVAVEPGQLWTFHIELDMPSQEGTYSTDWQMVHEQVRWFGEQVSSQVEVVCDGDSSSGGSSGEWTIVACARNGSEICDDESFWVPSAGMESGILCSEAEGGISYISANTGPTQSDGVDRCQGWEDQGLNAWDHLDYVASMVCDQQGMVLPVDLSAWAGGSLWFGSHDLPGGGGHMTSTCLVERPL